MGSLREELGNRIRQMRVAAGLSQPALAKRAEMDYKYLGGVERGERNLTIDNIERILNALGIEPHQLWISGTGKPLSPDKADLSVLNATVQKLDKTSRQQLTALAQHLLRLSKKK